MSNLVTVDAIRAAAHRIAPIARRTPLLDVSPAAGRPLHLKCENLQRTGAFKIRGGFSLISQLVEAGRSASGVITYSSGNHAQAVTCSARTLGLPAVVVMPTTAPAVKVEGTRAFGAEVMFEGTTSVERRRRAEAVARERNLTIIPPFDHPEIIAGQGTVGLEIVEDLPGVATVYVPIGGGGLASGVAVADDAIVDAVRWLAARAHLVVEPSGAATVAAILSGAGAGAGGETDGEGGATVAVLSGGNIAPDALARLLSSPRSGC